MYVYMFIYTHTYTQRETCDAAREHETTQTYKPRSLCTQSLLHGSDASCYLGSIHVTFRGHRFHALRL